jgi:hypothetical protein
MDTLKDIFLTFVDIFKTMSTAVLESLEEVRTTLCDASSGSGIDCKSEKPVTISSSHLRAGTGSLTKTGAKAIGAIFALVLKVIIEFFIPVAFLLVAFVLDVLRLMLLLFKTLLSGASTFLTRFFASAMKSFTGSTNIKDAGTTIGSDAEVQSFLNSETSSFLANTNGPAFIKKILLQILKLIKECARTVFHTITGLVILVDKSWCLVLYPLECVIKEGLMRIASALSSYKIVGQKLITPAFRSLASRIKACPCSYCPVQKSLPISGIISTTPCNMLVPDPVQLKTVGNGRTYEQLTDAQRALIQPCCNGSNGRWLSKIIVGVI